MYKHFQESLLSWFLAHCRPLPWRKDYTPYHIWIAEMMLQQTQMDRGIEYFQRWIDQFPDLHSVAAAPEDVILKAWEGLGYYRRAKLLQKAAKLIVDQYNGVFPSHYDAILSLPGIGPYTAGAIASIAFEQDIPCIDANVERILSRVFHLAMPLRQEPGKTKIADLAKALIPAHQARYFNQGLMECGELICRKNPDCPHCPLLDMCEAKRLGIVAKLPVPQPKTEIIHMKMATGVLLHKKKIFLQRRVPNDIWGSLWEFPGGTVEPHERPEQTVIREWQEETGFAVQVIGSIFMIKHSYTNYRIKLYAFLLDFVKKIEEYPDPPVLTAATDSRWVSFDELATLPLPAPHRKLAEFLVKNNMTSTLISLN